MANNTASTDNHAASNSPNLQHSLRDSGATGHFIIEHSHAANKQPDLHSITITLPDAGSTLKSTHTCNLDIPWLPACATQAQIVPGLTHSSLISISKFCDAGITMTFNKTNCSVYDGAQPVLDGKHESKPIYGDYHPLILRQQQLITTFLTAHMHPQL